MSRETHVTLLNLPRVIQLAAPTNVQSSFVGTTTSARLDFTVNPVDLANITGYTVITFANSTTLGSSATFTGNAVGNVNVSTGRGYLNLGNLTKANTNYAFSIASMTAEGTGLYSNLTSVITTPVDAPPKPAAPTITTPDVNKAVLTVSALKSKTDYLTFYLKQANNNAVLSTANVTVGAGNVVRNTYATYSAQFYNTTSGNGVGNVALTPGQIVYGTVVAVNNINGPSLESLPSANITIPSQSVPSTPLTGASSVSNYNNINLAWSPPVSSGGVSLTGYQIELYNNTDTLKKTVNVSATTLSYVFSAVDTSSPTYTCKVYAVNSIGNSPAASFGPFSVSKPMSVEYTAFVSTSASASQYANGSPFVVPGGISTISIAGVGAGSRGVGSGSGGEGGAFDVALNVPVTPGEVLKVYLGRSGYGDPTKVVAANGKVLLSCASTQSWRSVISGLTGAMYMGGGGPRPVGNASGYFRQQFGGDGFAADTANGITSSLGGASGPGLNFTASTKAGIAYSSGPPGITVQLSFSGQNAASGLCYEKTPPVINSRVSYLLGVSTSQQLYKRFFNASTNSGSVKVTVDGGQISSYVGGSAPYYSFTSTSGVKADTAAVTKPLIYTVSNNAGGSGSGGGSGGKGGSTQVAGAGGGGGSTSGTGGNGEVWIYWGKQLNSGWRA